jgi:hypothetical protein
VRGIALAIILIALVVTYWRRFRRVRTALGLDHLIGTGHAFLGFGVFLGLVFGEGPAPLVEDLNPVVALVSGWVGFATGMRFDLRVLRQIPKRAHPIALWPGVAAALGVGLAAGLVLLWAKAPRAEAWAATLVLGAAAASSGPTLPAMLRARRPGRSARARPVLRMIEFSAGLDDILVILLTTIAFGLFRPGIEPFAAGWFVGLSLGGGALLGMVIWLFLGGRATEDERLLLGLGMLTFIAGFAAWLHLPPAGVAAISAMMLVNLPGERMTELLSAVRRVERPAVVILMTVIGFHITGGLTWYFLPLVACMTALRFLTKRFAGDLVSKSLRVPGLRTRRGWGNGLAPQGPLGLMMALSLYHIWSDDLTRTVLGAVAVASVLNELVAPWLYLRMLQRITAKDHALRAPLEEGAA